MAFQLNGIAFFPIMGFSMAATTLVGKNLGRNRPDLANRAVWSAIHTSLCFVGGVVLVYLLRARLAARALRAPGESRWPGRRCAP